MGVIRKQSITNSVYNYAGILLGYLNLAILMTEILSVEEYGLRGVIFQLGSLFSVTSMLGSSNIMNRYFPFFRDKNNGHGNLLGFILVYTLIGIALTAILTVLFKPIIIEMYSEKAQLLVEYYYIIIPFGLSLSLFEALSSYSRVLLKSTMPVFIKEFGVRVLTTVLLIVLYFKLIDFEIFFHLYLYLYGFGALVLMFYLFRLGEWHVSVNTNFLQFPKLKEMLTFGFYTLFNASMNMIVRTADLVMLTYFSVSLSGLTAAGIYNFGMLIANVISVPSISLRQIAAPIIADAFKNNDLTSIEEIYKKTCITQLVAGLFAFSLVFLNLHSVFSMLKPAYAACEYVVYFIGIARLFEMASGLNNRIIMESKYYKSTVSFNVLLLVVVVISNLVFIPLFEINGAAFASAISILIITLAKIIYVNRKFGFNPYDWGTLKAVLITIVGILAIYFIPKTGNIIIDIGYRSILFTAFFGVFILWFKVSVDVNNLADMLFKKVFKRS